MSSVTRLTVVFFVILVNSRRYREDSSVVGVNVNGSTISEDGPILDGYR